MNDSERQHGFAVIGRLLEFAKEGDEYSMIRLSRSDVRTVLGVMEESSNVSRAILKALDTMRIFVDVVVEDKLTHDELLGLADFTKEQAALFAGAISTTVVEG